MLLILNKIGNSVESVRLYEIINVLSNDKIL